MESDEENLSSDDESLLDDSGDGDYCPSDDFFEDDEIYEYVLFVSCVVSDQLAY